MSATTLVCWKCGASLADLTLPLRRLEECRGCGAELHVCRLCEFYEVSVAKSCREPVAEEVKDKTRANFCDYFKPRPGAYTAAGDDAERARRDLAALFGDGRADDTSESAKRELEALFGRPPADPDTGKPGDS